MVLACAVDSVLINLMPVPILFPLSDDDDSFSLNQTSVRPSVLFLQSRSLTLSRSELAAYNATPASSFNRGFVPLLPRRRVREVVVARRWSASPYIKHIPEPPNSQAASHIQSRSLASSAAARLSTYIYTEINILRHPLLLLFLLLLSVELPDPVPRLLAPTDVLSTFPIYMQINRLVELLNRFPFGSNTSHRSQPASQPVRHSISSQCSSLHSFAVHTHSLND